MKTLDFAIPSEKATKRLKIKNTSNKKKIAISSNLLPLFGFEKSDRVVETSLGPNMGIKIEKVQDLFNTAGTIKKIYSRTYKHRRSNPIEVLYEVAGQKIIEESFPENCRYVHVELRQNVMYIRPILRFIDKAIGNARPEARHTVFAACSSGVDIATCFEPNGWSLHSLCEWRAPEARDAKRKSDLTETGAITALHNLKNGIRNLFLEDINHIDVSMIEQSIKESPATVFMGSVQCDELSPVKAKKLKESALDDLSSSLDMTFDMLRIACECAFPVLVYENVRGWFTSPLYKAFSLRLRKLGYKEHLKISDARSSGGLTSRVRGYVVFTALDAPFEFEPDQEHDMSRLWPIVLKHLPECRDVTHVKSLQEGLEQGRLRLITQDKAPTLLKSQPRFAKDSAAISKDGKLYWPSEALMKELMGMPEFSTECVASDIGMEIVGQSIEVPALSSVVRSVTRHVNHYFDNVLASA